ncbi:hypothetical protein L6452_30413 [Arctium lappa]|uniref:Uncharacterized protein n=1 Tax=Arctium lappa TaxID=4217 RepID=A0ACB8ZJI4_ARCLA|nr:hypothetical protein L6452_30413 [Arctium lappa]
MSSYKHHCSGSRFVTLQIRRPSGTPQEILNMGYTLGNTKKTGSPIVLPNPTPPSVATKSSSTRFFGSLKPHGSHKVSPNDMAIKRFAKSWDKQCNVIEGIRFFGLLEDMVIGFLDLGVGVVGNRRVVLMVAVSSMGKTSVSEEIWKKDENERGVGSEGDSYDDDDDSPDEVEVVADDE